MAFLFNLSLTMLLTWFTVEVYSDISATGFMVLLVFGGWNVVFWLFSFFYNKEAFYKAPKVSFLIVFYLKELARASLQVAYDIVTPHDYMNPALIAVPLDAETDFEITLLASLVTMTPGTLSIDVSKDRKTLYVHATYMKSGDPEGVKREIKEGFEKKILRITRSRSNV